MNRSSIHIGLALLPLLPALGCAKTQTAPQPDTQAAPVAKAAEDATVVPDTSPPEKDQVPDAFRATRPEPRPIAKLTLPTVTQWRLDNGLEVNLLASDKLPVVSMAFEFDVGAKDDPAGKYGLASVCLDLFSEGTKRLDKVAWSEALADHAVELYSPAALESSTIIVRSLERELPAALDLLAELIRSPGLRKVDFDRIIADRKASLAQSRGTASGIAQRLFPGLVWGKDHPYGRVQRDADLDAIKLADCEQWVAQLRPEGARLWVSGKVTREGLEAALKAKLGEWTGKAPAIAATADAPAPSGTIYAVQVDGAVQSVVIVGYPGPSRAALDYEATYLMAQIFGGSFSSRINMNLREKNGFAYGSSGRFSYRRHKSHLAVSASVETSTTALALAEMRKELDLMRAEPPKAEELSREQEGALLALPARFATAGDALGEIRGLAFFGLPADWYAGYQDRLRAVDLAAVHQAAKTHLAERDAVVLVVGDLTKPAKDAGGKTVREALDLLAADKVFGAGGLVILDVDGVPAK
jgi:predicted Zn-dependent peptidase